jgi:hypothetical protein
MAKELFPSWIRSSRNWSLSIVDLGYSSLLAVPVQPET